MLKKHTIAPSLENIEPVFGPKIRIIKVEELNTKLKGTYWKWQRGIGQPLRFLPMELKTLIINSKTRHGSPNFVYFRLGESWFTRSGYDEIRTSMNWHVWLDTSDRRHLNLTLYDLKRLHNTHTIQQVVNKEELGLVALSFL